MPDYPPLILSIDPGANGGVAVIDARTEIPGFESKSFVEAWPMPRTERDVADLLEEYRAAIRMVYLEAVHAMPPTIPGNTSVASFSFGKSYGFVRGLLVGMKIPFEDVSPQKWTKASGLVGGKKGTEKKNMHKQKAQQLFPWIKVTHAIADALLIAEYGRRLK